MLETFNFFLVQITLLAVVLLLHTYIGLHIIRRVLIFSDLALDQLAAFGAIVGIALGIKYGTAGSYLVSMAAVLIGCILLAVIKPKTRLIPREAVIGIIYGLALVASIMVADKLSGGTDCLTKTLSGSMLWITWPLVLITIFVYIVLMFFHYRYRKQIISLAENSENLKNEKLWDFFFFTSQGIITVLIVPIAGVLLAYGFLMIPAAIACMFTKGWGSGVKIGWSVGFTACLIGLFLSYNFDLPYGPTLMLALGLFFVCALIIRALLPGKN